MGADCFAAVCKQSFCSFVQKAFISLLWFAKNVFLQLCQNGSL
jgi:hypothetical protein